VLCPGNRSNLARPAWHGHGVLVLGHHGNHITTWQIWIWGWKKGAHPGSSPAKARTNVAGRRQLAAAGTEHDDVAPPTGYVVIAEGPSERW
jgi:hypothetical protein